MHEIITKLLSSPEGVALLTAVGGLGTYALMEGFKYVSTKLVGKEPENLLAFTIAAILANLGQWSAAAIGLIPMLHGTPFAAYSGLLLSAAVAIHQATKTALFKNLTYIWADRKAGSQIRKASVTQPVTNETVSATPPAQWPPLG